MRLDPADSALVVGKSDDGAGAAAFVECGIGYGCLDTLGGGQNSGGDKYLRGRPERPVKFPVVTPELGMDVGWNPGLGSTGVFSRGFAGGAFHRDVC
ncbi:hypothetical protein D3C80_1784860 [compost metagenome]